MASLSELHHHLADRLTVVVLLLGGLVHCHTDRPGAGQTGGGQASSGQRHLISIIWREKSSKGCVRDTYKKLLDRGIAILPKLLSLPLAGEPILLQQPSISLYCSVVSQCLLWHSALKEKRSTQISLKPFRFEITSLPVEVFSFGMS